jgi:hypothetical protein
MPPIVDFWNYSLMMGKNITGKFDKGISVLIV